MDNLYIIGITVCICLIIISFVLKMIKTYARILIGGAGVLGIYGNTTTLPNYFKTNDTNTYYVLNGNKVKEIPNDSLSYYKKNNVILKREF